MRKADMNALAAMVASMVDAKLAGMVPPVWNNAQASVATPATKVSKARGKAQGKRKAKSATPAWLIEKAKNRDARRALAAKMRDAGVEPTGEAWAQAKAAAGIK